MFNIFEKIIDYILWRHENLIFDKFDQLTPFRLAYHIYNYSYIKSFFHLMKGSHICLPKSYKERYDFKLYIVLFLK